MVVNDETAQASHTAIIIPAMRASTRTRGSKQPLASSKKACDACFAQKEKCIRQDDRTDCDRCKRLRKSCVSHRPIKPPGRKRLLPPARTPNPLTSTREPKLPYSLSPFGVLFKKLTREEELMVREFTNPSNFTAFMVMPRLGAQMHAQAVRTFLTHFDDLSDGCFSMYAAFAQGDGEGNLRRATRALRRFAGMAFPGTEEEFERWVWLGLTVVVFAHVGLGDAAAAVRRRILGHVVDMRGAVGERVRRHPLVVSLTTVDVFESLVYRRRPVGVLGDEGWGVGGVESFPGLLEGCVRFLWRLCGVDVGDAELDLLEVEVEEWQPVVGEGELGACSVVEASHLLTRARVHKTAILLYVHRLRHPFGEEDGKADALARSIFSDLDMATAMTKRAPEWVSLPVLLAGIEATTVNGRKKVQRDVEEYDDSISPKARAMMRDFLSAVWELRDAGQGWRWMDVVDEMPPLCVYI